MNRLSKHLVTNDYTIFFEAVLSKASFKILILQNSPHMLQTSFSIFPFR